MAEGPILGAKRSLAKAYQRAANRTGFDAFIGAGQIDGLRRGFACDEQLSSGSIFAKESITSGDRIATRWVTAEALCAGKKLAATVIAVRCLKFDRP